MVTGYFNSSRKTVKNQKTGYSQRAYVACLSWFNQIASTYVDDVHVDDVHSFLPGLEFIRMYALPKSVEVQAENFGESGALNKLWIPKFFIPGDSALLQSMLIALKNEDFLLLVEDADPFLDYKLQFGNSKIPARVRSMKQTTGNIYDGRKGWELEFIATERYFYYDSYTGYVLPPYEGDMYVI